MKKTSPRLSLAKETLRDLGREMNSAQGALTLPDNTRRCETNTCTTTLFNSVGCGPYPSYNGCGTGYHCY